MFKITAFPPGCFVYNLYKHRPFLHRTADLFCFCVSASRYSIFRIVTSCLFGAHALPAAAGRYISYCVRPIHLRRNRKDRMHPMLRDGHILSFEYQILLSGELAHQSYHYVNIYKFYHIFPCIITNVFSIFSMSFHRQSVVSTFLLKCTQFCRTALDKLCPLIVFYIGKDIPVTPASAPG